MANGVALTAAQMRQAEQAAMAAGVASAALMENAGAGAADVIMKAWTARPAVVLCGPGNNGGDGYVVARKLHEAGWPVKVLALAPKDKLSQDARLMADLFKGDCVPFEGPGQIEGAGLIVDAIFGTGLARPPEGPAKAAIDGANAAPAPAVAIDLPSGIDADTGAALGPAIEAARTVTFFARKPGHLLFPGRAYCGAVDIVDIGITADHLAGIPVDTFENHPALWAAQFRRPDWRTHKYHRGSVFAVSGPRHRTGAARLAAAGAQRIGAGLVTVLSSKSAVDINAGRLTSIMVAVAESPEEIAEALSAKDAYVRVGLIGPGAGVGDETRDRTLAVLGASSAAVLDADALTSFAAAPSRLFAALRTGDVMTPHEGEFARVFPGPEHEPRIDAARSAARRAGCVVVLKGPDTIIAGPDGRAAINLNAPPFLATAGSGDVLAGFIAGLLANGMPGFEAAAAGVWFHGAAGQAAGPAAIAEDLPRAVPAVMAQLLAPPAKGAGEAT